MEDRSWMQKKKSSFQVIPNYGIDSVTNWNESKEMPADQGCNDVWPGQFPRPLRVFSLRLVGVAALIRLGGIAQSSRENGAAQ
jgi:hypothetical protein